VSEENSILGEKTSNLQETKKLWNLYQLPEDMTGKSFLDVGCWAGGFCVESLERGAKTALGIDMVKSAGVYDLQKIQPFEFLTCDVFSEKFLEIPSFDIVLCSNVLYHVENVISLIFRLKTKTLEKLYLSSLIEENIKYQDIPVLQLLPDKSRDNNYSNWWVPNSLCIEQMLMECEFVNIKRTFYSQKRACFEAIPKNSMCKKILPRKREFM